ncbi:MAG: VOC family protein [Candidatus Pacebacteria bacterium]|nr:VOC family protein [Candidatus Paceibacterota bacterium]
MRSKLNPYLNFDGTAKDAMEFYKAALGGELTMSTFGEAGMTHEGGDKDKIMHAMLVTESGITLMASDTPPEWTLNVGNNVSVSLSGDDDAELTGYWEKLSAGGTVDQPLVQAPWGDKFGMFTDKFGIRWMLNIAAAK